MDDEVVLAVVDTAGGVVIAGTGINRHVLQITVSGKHNHVAGNQIFVSLGFIGVLGNAAAALGSQSIQGTLPGVNCGQIVEIAVVGIGTHFLGLLIDVAGIHALDVGQIVTQVVSDKGCTHQTIGLEVGELGSLTGNRAGIRNGFVTVGTCSALPVSNVGQNLGRRIQDIAAGILPDIQVSVLLQVLDVIAGVFQGTQDGIIPHLLGDVALIQTQHGDAVGIRFLHGVEGIHGNTIGIGIIRVIGIEAGDGFRQIITDDLPFLRQCFRITAASHIGGRHCSRGKPQDQNDGHQKRKQPFTDCFQIQILLPLHKISSRLLAGALGAIFNCRYYP